MDFLNEIQIRAKTLVIGNNVWNLSENILYGLNVLANLAENVCTREKVLTLSQYCVFLCVMKFDSHEDALLFCICNLFVMHISNKYKRYIASYNRFHLFIYQSIWLPIGLLPITSTILRLMWKISDRLIKIKNIISWLYPSLWEKQDPKYMKM